MFRTSKCSSSGRFVHPILWYFFRAAIQTVWTTAGCAWYSLLQRYITIRGLNNVKFLLLDLWLVPCIFILKTAAVLCVETWGRLHSYAAAIRICHWVTVFGLCEVLCVARLHRKWRVVWINCCYVCRYTLVTVTP